MQDISMTSVNNNQKPGYYVPSKRDKKAQFYQTESHIYRQSPLSGLKVGAYKFAKNFTTYLPKGLKGSPNSDFYEFLSLGSMASFFGSATLIALYNLANNLYKGSDASAAKFSGKQFLAGVLLYNLAKIITPRIVHKGLKYTTGVNLDMYCANKINELPEKGQEQGKLTTQYSKVFASRDFYRGDLLNKDSEINHGDIDAYNKKIARKAGYKGELNAANQVADGKIRELISRTISMDNITKYVVAATGVALGSREAFKHIEILKPTSKANIKSMFSSFGIALRDGFRQLWSGNNSHIEATKPIRTSLKETFGKIKNFNIKNVLNGFKNINLDTIRKHSGKALILGSMAMIFLNWLIPTIKFKSNPNTMKSRVDESQEYEVG